MCECAMCCCLVASVPCLIQPGPDVAEYYAVISVTSAQLRSPAVASSDIS